MLRCPMVGEAGVRGFDSSGVEPSAPEEKEDHEEEASSKAGWGCGRLNRLDVDPVADESRRTDHDIHSRAH